MQQSWRYRVASFIGVVLITAVVVTLTNHSLAQSLLTVIPIVNRLRPITYTNGELFIAVLTAVFIAVIAFLPLFRPQPRRILDTIFETERRLFLTIVSLAAIGYFDYTYRLPRTTLIATTITLGILLPIWFIAIQPRPSGHDSRAVIIGDDPQTMEDILQVAEIPVVGYIAPLSPYDEREIPPTMSGFTDGGVVQAAALDDLAYLGDLTKLEEVFIKQNIDTSILAFDRPNRVEFFGTLLTCDRLNLQAKVHREHADSVLTRDIGVDELLDVDLEPWDWQDRVLKRLFDIVFAAVGLLVLIPVIVMISIAIKLNDRGSILYAQERTTEFGETFTIYKFRSMVEDAESESGVMLSEEDAGGIDPRVTRIGKFIRKTHLDEIPQIWSILVGDMSVVGPRPERPELDSDIEREQGVGEWRRRWFVKPGLTGLAQISGATGFDPEEKIRYDIEYIRQQSFWFDVKIVVRQLFKVIVTAADTIKESK